MFVLFKKGYHRRSAAMVSFVVFFDCRVSGRENDKKSFIINVFAFIIS